MTMTPHPFAGGGQRGCCARRATVRASRGMTLIEVLVAILLMSLGVLAMAALQVNSVMYSKSSETRAVAALLANDLADRIRANLASGVALSAYNLHAVNGTDIVAPASAPNAAPVSCQNTAATGGGAPSAPTPCSSTDMAAFDLAQWRRSVFNLLPQGTARIEADGGDVKVWVIWTDAESSVGLQVDACPSNVNLTTNPQARCMFFRITP